MKARYTVRGRAQAKKEVNWWRRNREDFPERVFKERQEARLVSVSEDGAAERYYVYDENGNRLCRFEAPAFECDGEAVFDAQDRLRSYEGVSYSYTDRGSLFQRQDGTRLETFAYDAFGAQTRGCGWSP